MAATVASQITLGLGQGQLKGLQGRFARRTVRPVSRVVCSADKSVSQQAASAAAAAALAVAISVGAVQPAQADVAGLTPCAESKAYAKRQKTEVKALQKRLKLYEADSAPALAIQATIDRTEKRFDNYAKAGLLCGTDGLPHLIADPGLAFRYGHTGEVFIPTILFLYVAGWIGYVGRNYLNAIKSEKKPTEREIIIDVPLALKLAFQGAAWPLPVVNELRKGVLTEDDANITVSPR